MDEQKPEQLQDDQGVEITDLDKPGAEPSSSRLVSRFASLPFDRRYRRPVTLVSFVLALLAIALILTSTTSLRSLLPGAGAGLSAQPTQPGKYTYIIQATPAWGHLFVDGQSARLYPDQGLRSILLSPGRHRLAWRAVPFTQQQCTIEVPPESGVDTCTHPVFTMLSSGRVDSIIVFHGSLSLLAPTTRAALIQAAQQALNGQQSADAVQPGEVYAISSLAFNTASNPCVLSRDQSAALCYQSTKQLLRATVSFQLDTDTSSGGPCVGGTCIFNGEDCRLFCDAPAYELPVAPSPSSSWNTYAIVHILWHYYTPRGQLVVPAETDSFIWGQQDEHLVSLSITWDGLSWHVTTHLDYQQPPLIDPMCDAALGDVGTLLFADARTSYSFETVPASTFALGCLIKVQLFNGPATSTPSSAAPVAYLLHRFGVLLAVNEEAHRLLPFLPLADVYEVHLAEQLGAQS